ncbi:MAG: efflux RND transporter periplasmic adaptor subunit [Proteobacteria bacterium]|nr:efflux RND transporter periplasmic adaptor subunit [Pseudomonadota bacterium]
MPETVTPPSPATPAGTPPSSKVEPGTGRPRGLLVAVGLLLVAALAAFWFFGRSRGESSAARAAPAPLPVTVSHPLQREIVEWDEFTGQFAAVEYVEMRARVSGYLQSINFRDGQIVNKGDLLFIIDPRPFEIALSSVQAQLAQANARLELATRELARAGQLRERDFVAGSVYDQRVQEQRVAAAVLETAKAAIRSAQLDLDFTRITAPVGGRASRHEVSIGNLVVGGAGGPTTLLTTIVALDPIYFTFDMSEADLLAYQRAAATGKFKSARDGALGVFAHLFDETKWTLEGRLDFLDNQVDRSSGTIRARATFPNRDLFITPGQFGRIRIPGSEPYQATLVPDSAVVTDQSRKIVMTVKDDGTVVPKIVRPGPTSEGLRVIRSGLEASDMIIINGLVRARPGAKVAPQPGTITPSASD